MAWSGFRNRKDGPQQGTLFDVRQVPSQRTDHPRMRREEMVRAMPPVTGGKFTTEGDGYLLESREFEGVRNKIEQRRHRGNPDAWTDSEIEAESAFGNQHRADMGRRLAARTTVQPEHLQGLTRVDIGITGNSGDPEGDADAFGGAVGRYFADEKRIDAPARMDTPTLAHEVGHHVSYTENPAPRGLRRVWQGLDPHEEAFADDFAETHVVGGGGGESGYTNITDEGFRGYHQARKNRPENLSSSQFGGDLLEQMTAPKKPTQGELF